MNEPSTELLATRTYSHEEMEEMQESLELSLATIRNLQAELELLRSRPRRTEDDDVIIQCATEAMRRTRVYFESVPQRIIRVLVSNQGLDLKDPKSRMKLYKVLLKELDTSSLLRPKALLRAIGVDQ